MSELSISMSDWTCGLCVLLEIGSGDTLLVPVNRFEEGERVFGIVRGQGADWPSVKLNRRQEKRVTEFIAEYKRACELDARRQELRKQMDALEKAFRAECPHFN